jgi:hypothetical protein
MYLLLDALGLNDLDGKSIIRNGFARFKIITLNNSFINCYTPIAELPKVVRGWGVLLGASKPVNRYVYKILDLGKCPEKSRFSPRWSILQGWKREDGLVKVFLPPPPLPPFPLCDLTPPPLPPICIICVTYQPTSSLQYHHKDHRIWAAMAALSHGRDLLALVGAQVDSRNSSAIFWTSYIYFFLLFYFSYEKMDAQSHIIDVAVQ